MALLVFHSLCQHTLSTYKAQKLCTKPNLKETEPFAHPKSNGNKTPPTPSALTPPPTSFFAMKRIPCELHRKAHLENSTKFYKI